jgi:hypothetical protein
VPSLVVMLLMAFAPDRCTQWVGDHSRFVAAGRLHDGIDTDV